MSNHSLRVSGTVETLTRDLAARIVKCGRDAIAGRGAFHWALSGGSTPKALFALLAFDGGAYDWWPLALFLGAGLLDMVDGKVARARSETSAFGARTDLIGDRLLTFAAVLGLIVGGGLAGVDVVAGIVLIARDLIVASLNEALPGKLGPRGQTSRCRSVPPKSSS